MQNALVGPPVVCGFGPTSQCPFCMGLVIFGQVCMALLIMYVHGLFTEADFSWSIDVAANQDVPKQVRHPLPPTFMANGAALHEMEPDVLRRRWGIHRDFVGATLLLSI
ncbi:hypothetical protein VNO77_18874 [Canavalia gladiata]|uniref:Uncharacterized protein n=1 Tax=Canavalia gladiata TaxID=3824 RepID=A0AAN9QI20_CANGL